MNTVIMLAGIAAISMLLPAAHAVLWDLIIDAGVTERVEHGSNFVVSGSVANHAGWPERSTVQVRAGQDMVSADVGPDGYFEVSISGNDLLPGTHIANIRASTDDGLFGMASVTFRVDGDVKPSSYTVRLLSTDQAIKYLKADKSDFDENPLGMTLYNYYNELQQQFIHERAAETSAEERRLDFARTQAESKELRQKAIEDEHLGAGTFGGHDRTRFLDGLDKDVRDLFAAQLDYTLDVFNDSVSADTTHESLRERHASLAIPRHVMEQFMPQSGFDINDYSWAHVHSYDNSTADTKETIDAEPAAAPENVPPEPSTPQVAVDPDATTVYLSIDGVMTRHTYNGTHLVRAD